MRVLCQGCHTKYELPEGKEGQVGCPYCEHVNRPEEELKPSSAPPPRPQSGGFDANRTMVAPLLGDFGEETTAARTAIDGKKVGLPLGYALSLLVQEGDQKGQRLPLLKAEVTIGRKGTDIVLSDPESSRRHCSITIYGNIVLLQDLESANGTMVNDRVIKTCILKNGDAFQIGMTVLKLSIEPRP
jgi:hypothetical protein